MLYGKLCWNFNLKFYCSPHSFYQMAHFILTYALPERFTDIYSKSNKLRESAFSFGFIAHKFQQKVTLKLTSVKGYLTKEKLKVERSIWLNHLQTHKRSLYNQNTRRVTRNFSGQGRFLKIRALRQILNQQHTNERPRREKFWRFFFLYTLKTAF